MGDIEPDQNEPLESWIIALCAVINKFFNGGIQRIGTLLFVECMNRYNVNRRQASVPFTVSYVFLFCLGPFVGGLERFFELRTLIISGAVLSAIGVLINFWAEDIIFMTIFWGVAFGVGFGISNALIPEILNRHFEKHLSIANGLFAVGSSIGATALPYLSNVLIKMYGLSAAFLLLGGLTLNIIPVSFLMHDYPKMNTKNTNSNTNLQKNKTKRHVSFGVFRPEHCYKLKHNNNHSNCKTQKFANGGFVTEESYNTYRTRNSFEESDTTFQLCEKTCLNSVFMDLDKYDEAGKMENSYSYEIHPASNIQNASYSPYKEHAHTNAAYINDDQHNMRHSSENQYLSENQTQQTTCSNFSYLNAANTSEKPSSSVMTPTLSSNAKMSLHRSSEISREKSNPTKSFLSTFSVLISPTFLAIEIMISCFMGVLMMFNVMILDYAAEKGVHPDQNIYVLLAFSSSDMVGRLGVGWIVDCGLVNLTYFIVAHFILLGLDCLAMALCYGFVLYLLAASVLGLVLGVLVSYTPKLIKDFIEPRERTMAVSSRYFVFTPVAVAMPYILGDYV